MSSNRTGGFGFGCRSRSASSTCDERLRAALALLFIAFILAPLGFASPAHAAAVVVSTPGEFYQAIDNAPAGEQTVVKLTTQFQLSSSGTKVGAKTYRDIELKTGQDIVIEAADPQKPVTVENNVNTELFTVPKDASLTFGDGFKLRGKASWVSKHQVNVDGGTFTMRTGSEVFGSREMFYGAIYVHNGGVFNLEGGTLRDNWVRTQSSFSAGALVIENGTANLRSGTLTGNGYDKDKLSELKGYNLGGAIAVKSGGVLSVYDGTTISENAGNYGGGILAYSDHDNRKNPDGSARVTIHGGTIEKNVAYRDGAGIYAVGNTDVTVSGGSISNNSVTSLPSGHGHGGGIAIWDGCFGYASSTYTENTTCRYGAEITSGMSFAEATKAFPAKLTISGGTIKGNSAMHSGGGIYVATANAVISGGRIADNTAGYWGGGMYVATRPYVAKVTKAAAITKNKAVARANALDGYGGGIWAEYYGNVVDGSSVFDNSSETKGADYAFDPAAATSQSRPVNGESTLNNRLAGGGAAQWIGDDNNPLPADAATGNVHIDKNTGYQYLRLKATEAVKELARTKASVVFEGNQAARGGGIATAGTVIFVEDDQFDINVLKKWAESGTDPAAEVDPNDIPAESLDFALVRVDGDRETELERFTLTSETATELGKKVHSWALTLNSLPITDPDGTKIQYRIIESGPDGKQRVDVGSSSKDDVVDVDVVNRVPIADVAFDIRDEQGTRIPDYAFTVVRAGTDETVFDGKTPADRGRLSKKLGKGTYRVKAVRAADGYKDFADVTLTVDADGRVKVADGTSAVIEEGSVVVITVSKVGSADPVQPSQSPSPVPDDTATSSSAPSETSTSPVVNPSRTATEDDRSPAASSSAEPEVSPRVSDAPEHDQQSPSDSPAWRDRMPRTGADVTAAIVCGGLLVLAGALLVVRSKKRR